MQKRGPSAVDSPGREGARSGRSNPQAWSLCSLSTRQAIRTTCVTARGGARPHPFRVDKARAPGATDLASPWALRTPIVPRRFAPPLSHLHLQRLANGREHKRARARRMLSPGCDALSATAAHGYGRLLRPYVAPTAGHLTASPPSRAPRDCERTCVGSAPVTWSLASRADGPRVAYGLFRRRKVVMTRAVVTECVIGLPRTATPATRGWRAPGEVSAAATRARAPPILPDPVRGFGFVLSLRAIAGAAIQPCRRLVPYVASSPSLAAATPRGETAGSSGCVESRGW